MQISVLKLFTSVDGAVQFILRKTYFFDLNW